MSSEALSFGACAEFEGANKGKSCKKQCLSLLELVKPGCKVHYIEAEYECNDEKPEK